MSTKTEFNDKRLKKDKIIIIRWASIIFIALLLFIFFAFFANRFGQASLELDLKERKISINTKELFADPEVAKKIDPEKYYIDSSRNFLFKKPVSGDWNKPQLLKGIDEYLDAKSILLNPEIKDKIVKGMKIHPLGPMVQAVETIRYTTGDTISVECSDQSTTDLLEKIIQNTMEYIKVKDEKVDMEEIEEAIKIIRKKYLGFSKLQFTNEFCVSVYDKNMIKGVPIKLSLPNFAIFILSAYP